MRRPERSKDPTAAARARCALARSALALACMGALPSGPGMAADSAPMLRHEVVRPDAWSAPEEVAAAVLGELGWPEGVALADLEILAVRSTPRLLHVDLGQTAAGLPIAGTRIDLRFDRMGRLVHARARVVDVSGMPPTNLRPPSAAAGARVEAAALAAFSSGASGITWHESRAMLWPGAPEHATLTPAWRVHWSTDDPPGRWECILDAETLEILQVRDRLVFESLDGVVEADIEPRTAGDPTVRVPLPHLAVSITRGEQSWADTTDAEGRFAFELPESTRVQRRGELRGRAVWVRDVSDRLRTPFDTLTVDVPGTADLRWRSINSTLSERDAYFHATRGYDVIRGMDRSPALAALDRTVELRVDDPSGACNAYWRGDYLSFFAAGRGCAALARVADVVYHEYAHVVTQYCYAPFGVPTDVNEGLSDYFAATLTDQPRIGVGFRGPGSYLREIETDRVWPLDQHADPHLQGLILAGALWDLRTSIGPLADTLAHFARYGAAESQHDFLLDVLLVDDDDGNLRNGTPHFGAIVDAFLRHGLGDYSVRLSSDPLPDIEFPPDSLSALVEIDALVGLDPDSLGMYLAVEESFERLRLRPVPESPGLYRATFPSPDSGVVLRYYFSAADTLGHSARLPASAPAEAFRFRVGPDRLAPVLTHEPWEHFTARNASLRVRAQARDNSGLIAQVEATVDAGAGATSHPLAPRGGGIFEGKIPVGALVPGSHVRYSISAHDQASLPNEGVWPDTGQVWVPVRPGETLEFELEPGPLTPSGDWTWATPPLGGAAWSGERVWCSGPDGAYSDDTISILAWGPLDLSSWGRARLEFRHRYGFETGYDGGRVEASTDGGATWDVLPPTDDYPHARVEVFDSAGFSGAQPEWTRVIFALDRHLAADTRIRLVAVSDAFVSDVGWWIDDLRVVGAQALAPPLALRAGSGQNAAVSLTWQHAPGIDRESPRFLGYRVSRREVDSTAPPTPLHVDPVELPRFTDVTAQNGTAYEFQVVALYDEGSSAPRVRTATPYAAAIEVDVPEMDVRTVGSAERDTTFFIRNSTPGDLRFNSYLADSGRAVTDVRWVADLSPVDAAPQRWTDPSDPSQTVDLLSLDLSKRDDPELGPLLEFTLRGREAWGDPIEAWGGAVLLDTDLDLGSGTLTSRFGWGEETNIGWDRAILFGRLAHEAHPDAPVVLLAAGGGSAAVPLHDWQIPIGGDSIRVVVPWDLLDRAPAAQVAVVLGLESGEALYDHAPDLPRAPWLEREPRSGRALPGHPQPFSLRFDPAPVGNGVHHATLFIVSNDPVRPTVEIPARFTVEEFVQENLESLSFQSQPEGLLVSFVVPAALSPRFARAERWDPAARSWGHAGPDTLFARESGEFSFLDSEIEAGARALYRFRVVFEARPVRVYGPFDAEYTPVLPSHWAVSVGPNPFRESCRFRIEAPRRESFTLRIYDLGGRLRRTVHDGEVRAGVRFVDWDGRDARGEPVPSGAYWARLTWPEGDATRRVMRLR